MNNKGITPVIAVILLLLMTVGAAGAAYVWLTSVQTRIQSSIEQQLTQQTKRQGSAISIVFAICDDSGDYVKVGIRNVGTSSISIGDTSPAYLVVMNTNGAVIATKSNNSDISISVGEVKEITFTGVTEINGGQTYSIKVSMPNGAEQTESCLAS